MTTAAGLSGAGTKIFSRPAGEHRRTKHVRPGEMKFSTTCPEHQINQVKSKGFGKPGGPDPGHFAPDTLMMETMKSFFFPKWENSVDTKTRLLADRSSKVSNK